MRLKITNSNLKIPNFWFLLSAITIFCILFHPAIDPDFWWHIRLGDDMLKTGNIPRVDTLSWTAADRPFVDMYWLSEVIIASMHRVLPLYVLTALYAGLTTGTILLAFRTKGPFRFSHLVSAFLIALTFYSATGIRPVAFSWLFTVVFLLIIDRWKTWSYQRLLLIATPLAILWHNLHHGASFLVVYLGFTLLLHGFAILISWVDLDFPLKPFLRKTEPVKYLILIGILIATQVFTPYGFTYFSMLFLEAASPTNRHYISEWKPASFTLFYGLIFFSLPIIVLGVGLAKKYITEQKFIVLLVMFSIAATSKLHIPFYLLLLAPDLPKVFTSIRFPKSVIPLLRPYFALLMTLFAVLLCGYSWAIESTNPTETYPATAVAIAKRLQLHGKMFNSYNWGGYLTYALPEQPVFIYGAMSAWSYHGRVILPDQSALEMLEPSFKEILQVYQPDWFFISPQAPLAQYLKDQPGYHVLYEDDIAIIIAKRSSHTAY